MLIQIRGEFEKCLGAALPNFRRFNARVTRLSESDLPCVNLYFHRDRLTESGNISEEREGLFEIEVCMKAGGDPESELTAVRKRIEDALESNDALQNMIMDLTEDEVDFAHEMVGESRVAALAMTWKVRYQRPHFLPPPPPHPHEVWANGEKLIG